MYAAVLLERRMIGAGLVALVLLGLAITNLTSAVAVPRVLENPASSIFFVNVVLSILAAVGIHLLVFEDMTYELRVTNRRLEAAREELLQAAITDPLTGCHNRRFLGQVQDRELKRHERFTLPLSLLFIDIDKFKAINDTLGHEAGDRVLQYVAPTLQLLLGIGVYHEPFAAAKLVGYVAIWIALIIFTGEGLWSALRSRQ